MSLFDAARAGDIPKVNRTTMSLFYRLILSLSISSWAVKFVLQLLTLLFRWSSSLTWLPVSISTHLTLHLAVQLCISPVTLVRPAQQSSFWVWMPMLTVAAASMSSFLVMDHSLFASFLFLTFAEHFVEDPRRWSIAFVHCCQKWPHRPCSLASSATRNSCLLRWSG